MMRIALFLLTNPAVMVVFGLVLSLTGDPIQQHDRSSDYGPAVRLRWFYRFADDVEVDGAEVQWVGK